MWKALGPLALAIVLAVPALVPTAGAHAAPDPLANAEHVLADEGEDTFYWYDGYDLYNLFVREAYVETLDETGLVLRFTLYGGFAPTGTSDQLAIDVAATGDDGEQFLTMTTSDDETWEGDLEVLVANVTEDAPPFTGVTARMQVFAAYEQLGTGVGSTVKDVRMVSRADQDVRDVAPGGFYVPNSQGQGEVPAESERLVDELALDGPHDYVDVETTTTETGLNVTVENTLENGQHVTVELDRPDGWNATVNGSAQTSLPGGETTTFAVDAEPTPDANASLGVEIVTDLGGREQVFAGVNGTEIVTGIEPNAVEVDPASPEPNESPAPAAMLAVALLAALALASRRPSKR